MRASMKHSVLSLVIGLSLMAIATATFAEQKKEENKYAVSQETFKVLEQARKLMQQKSYSASLDALNALLPKVTENAYETALVYEHQAYVYLDKQDYSKSVGALEKTLQYAETLPPDTVHSLRYDLAQAAAQTEQWQKAATAIDRWFGSEQKPSGDAWYLRAVVQYQLKHLNQAADYLKQAMSRAHHENWSLFLLSIYLELKQYRQAGDLLGQLVNRYPDNKTYWIHLTDVNLMRRDYAAALATLQLAQYRIKLGEEEIFKLARLYLQNNIPYSAAKLLEQASKDGRVKTDYSSLKLLADSWAAARQPEKELHYLTRAADMQKDGTLYQRAGQILFRLERWREAVKMFDNALTKGLKSPGQSYLLKGIAAHQAGQAEVAAKAFERAGRYKDTRQQAEQWLAQVKGAKSAS